MSKKMKGVIYVAGLYRSGCRAGVLQNMAKAAMVAGKLRERGYTVIVPHLESFYNEDCMNEMGWLDHGIRLLSLCDAVIFLDGWRDSGGSRLEYEEAMKQGMAIFGEDIIEDLRTSHLQNPIRSRHDDPINQPTPS